MKNAMKRWLSLLLTVLMVATALPFAALAEGETAADGLIEEDLVPVEPEQPTETKPTVNVSNAVSAANLLAAGESAASNADDTSSVGGTWTVTFNTGEAGSTVEPVTVANGGTVDPLPVPAWEADGTGKAFDGWYTETTYQNEFTNATLVDKDTTVYAKWVEIGTNDGKYYVNFYNNEGDTVLVTLVAEKDQTVGEYSNVPVVEGKRFLGWSATKQEGKTKADFTEFDFSQKISDLTGDKNSIDLYAWYWDYVTITFNANRGTAVMPLTPFKGDQVTSLPETTRQGYKFKYWASDEAGTTEFTTPATVDENITLYAVWEPDFVKVTITYMLEKADHGDTAEYEMAGKSLEVYAPSGSTIKIEKNSITDLNQSHAIKYSLNPDADNAVWENVRTSADGTDVATLPDIHETYFQYASNSRPQGIEVLPNGTTVLLAYYDRAVITLTFSYVSSVAGSLDTTNLRGEYSGDGISFTYKFSARYGQSISDAWPSVSLVTGSNSGKGFGGWEKPNGQAQFTNVRFLVKDLFEGTNATTESTAKGLEIEGGKLVAKFTLNSVFQNVNPCYVLYARETLPTQTADFYVDTTGYTIDSTDKLTETTGWLNPKVLDGCDTGSIYVGEYQTGEFSVNQNTTSLNGATIKKVSGQWVPVTNGKILTFVNSKTLENLFTSEFGSGIVWQTKTNTTQATRFEVLIYDRVRYDITLHNVYGNIVGETVTDNTIVKSDAYLHEQNIYSDINDIESAMRRDGYTFVGWYTSPDFNEATRFELGKDSVITGDLELYAKWETGDYTAKYYLYTDSEDKDTYKTQKFKDGDYLTDYDVPDEVKEYFVGWYYYNEDGILVKFNFEDAVGEGFVDSKKEFKLYGQWKSDAGKVQYRPGEGGDSDTPSPIDETEYKVGTAMVCLKDYTEVWKDGSVPTDTTLKFIGWQAPNGAVYQPGKWVLVTRPLMQFTAIWSKDAVTLTYHANGGTGSDVSENYPRNYKANIWDNKDYNDNTGKWEEHFTYSGYELIGWDTEQNATTPTYELGKGDITLTADHTDLYAIWKRCVADVVLGKVVDGNMGSWSKIFTFSVYYTVDNVKTELSPVTLSHNQTATLPNIPIGATITITESDYDSYTPSWVAGVTAATGTASALKEAISGSDTSGFTATATVAESGTTIIFTNVNEVTVDTGILLDSLPYVLILALVAVALVVWFIRRRRDD